MTRFYLKFRIGLMTFALGLASFFILNGSLNFSDEIPVDSPETKFENVLISSHYAEAKYLIPLEDMTGCRLIGLKK